jgi:hypothetical protein
MLIPDHRVYDLTFNGFPAHEGQGIQGRLKALQFMRHLKKRLGDDYIFMPLLTLSKLYHKKGNGIYEIKCRRGRQAKTLPYTWQYFVDDVAVELPPETTCKLAYASDYLFALVGAAKKLRRPVVWVKFGKEVIINGKKHAFLKVAK